MAFPSPVGIPQDNHSTKGLLIISFIKLSFSFQKENKVGFNRYGLTIFPATLQMEGVPFLRDDSKRVVTQRG